jgi:hypothetical protein
VPLEASSSGVVSHFPLAVAGQTTPRYRFRLDALGCDHAHEMPVADDIRAPDWFVARFRIARAERKSV